MKLVKNASLIADGRKASVVENDWTLVDDDAELPEGKAVVVSLARFRAERDKLVGRNAPLGLRLKSNEAPASVADDLDRIALVALEFPIFRDGRGYSHAVQLRQRFGFDGEVRAVGDVLWDQIPHMIRCGIDSFEVGDDFPLAAFDEAATVFTRHYQPDTTGRPTINELRHG
ncbi:DUF934 domain-containing protein [Zavarzinia aquatilis]|uniref:Oxidoreductase n=1 Tax=Zavarzinia aquatilis TaxID=2211142 RepID=A0A317DVH4_9PROT|nr:DUF934 domain-containing protein [Zavarzinia aquatilis]PWR17876.1 oxidoreductase [Zavarzinia aquatilis]